jgi:hypothetical protein
MSKLFPLMWQTQGYVSVYRLVTFCRDLYCNSDICADMKTTQLPTVAAIFLLLGVVDVALVSYSLRVS